MSRPISERVKDWRYWGEQVAHILLGGTTAAFTAIGHPVLACTSAAAWFATWREWMQRPVDSWADTAIDWVFTVLGGLVLGLIIWTVA